MPRPDLSDINYFGNLQTNLDITRAALRPFVVERYRQADAIENAFGGDSDIRGGACLALSMHWIRQHQSNRNAPRLGEAGLLNSLEVMVAARNIQQAYERAKRRDGGQDQAANAAGIAFACKLFQMSLVGGLTHHHFDDAAFLGRLRQVHRYHIIAMAGFGIGHAICTYASSGKVFGRGRHVYLFDPNIGELKIPERDIGYAIEALTAFYRLLRQNYVHCYVGEIKP